MKTSAHLNEVIKDVDYHMNKVDDEEKEFLQSISNELESVKKEILNLESRI